MKTQTPQKEMVQVDAEKIKELRKFVMEGLNTKIELPTDSYSVTLEKVLKSGYDKRGQVLNEVLSWIGNNCPLMY